MTRQPMCQGTSFISERVGRFPTDSSHAFPKPHVVSLVATIQLCTYNRAHLLARVLDACFEQDVAPDAYEVVLVDDGSSDGTPLVIEAAKARARVPFTVVSQANAGLARARNAGIAASSGLRIILIDDDVLPMPNLVAEHLRAAVRNSDLVVRGAVIEVESFDRAMPSAPYWTPKNYSAIGFGRAMSPHRAIVSISCVSVNGSGSMRPSRNMVGKTSSSACACERPVCTARSTGTPFRSLQTESRTRPRRRRYRSSEARASAHGFDPRAKASGLARSPGNRQHESTAALASPPRSRLLHLRRRVDRAASDAYFDELERGS